MNLVSIVSNQRLIQIIQAEIWNNQLCKVKLTTNLSIMESNCNSNRHKMQTIFF